MTTAPSPSHRRKLIRAERHIKEVEALVEVWLDEGYRVFEEPNPEGRFVLFAEQVKPLPDDLALAIGDAVQCLRSSLDHIVFALARRHTPGMTPQQERDTEFPIKSEAIQPKDKRLACVEPSVRKEICALAPDPARQQLNRDPLWVLNELSNRDKHREIAVVVGIARFAGYRLIASDGSDYFRLLGGVERLELGAPPVALYEFARSPGVHAEMGHAVEIVFDEGLERGGREVRAALRWFHDHIRDTVFKGLEPYL